MPSHESLTEPVDGLSEEGGGEGAKVEIQPQQNIHPDQSGHEERLGSLSFGENDGVWSERGAPSRFFGLVWRYCRNSSDDGAIDASSLCDRCPLHKGQIV